MRDCVSLPSPDPSRWLEDWLHVDSGGMCLASILSVYLSARLSVCQPVRSSVHPPTVCSPARWMCLSPSHLAASALYALPPFHVLLLLLLIILPLPPSASCLISHICLIFIFSILISGRSWSACQRAAQLSVSVSCVPPLVCLLHLL